MPQKVELVFKRERSKERPRELLLRHAREQQSAGSPDWEVFDDGNVSRTAYGVDEPMWISFRGTFFIGSKHFITRRPAGNVHILEHRQVDEHFFKLFKYPDPGPLWDLIHILKRRTERDRRFSGPNNLRKLVRNVTETDRASYGLEPDPSVWQAVLECRCGTGLFNCQYSGSLSTDGLLCDLPDVYQRAVLSCTACSTSLTLFDATSNGYNAVICEWPPPSKSERPLAAYQCMCGRDDFTVAVEAVYDADPESLDELGAAQRNESFGWFSAKLRCSACSTLRVLIDYECA